MVIFFVSAHHAPLIFAPFIRKNRARGILASAGVRKGCFAGGALAWDGDHRDHGSHKRYRNRRTMDIASAT